MPILNQETITLSPYSKRNTPEVPPSINRPETVATENFDHERNVFEMLSKENRNVLDSLPREERSVQSETIFDERMLGLLDQILAGKTPPLEATPIPVNENEPILRVEISETEQTLATSKINTETESLKSEKTRGDLKTRINIRRCTIESVTEAEPQSDSKHDTRSKHKSRKLTRSNLPQELVPNVVVECKVDNKKPSDVPTDEDTESGSRKQSLRSQQAKDVASVVVKDASAPAPVKDSPAVKLKIKIADIKNKNESETKEKEEERIEGRDASVEKRDKSIEKKGKSLEEKDKPEEKSDNSIEKSDKSTKKTEKSLEEGDTSIEKCDIPTEKKDKSLEKVDKVTEKREKSNENRVKTPAEKKRITRASVIDDSTTAVTPSIESKGVEDSENTVSVKSLRSRQRVSYVEAVEEQFATFDSSESEDENLYKKAQEKSKKKKQQKTGKNLVSSTKETQVTENIFDCNVMINNVQVNQVQVQIKQTEIRQNVKYNKKQRSVSCENKDVLINKKSLRSLKANRSEDTGGEIQEKSQSLSNLDQITTATLSKPTSSFNNEFIDFLKNTVNIPDPVLKLPSKPVVEKVLPIEEPPCEKEPTPAETVVTEVTQPETIPEPSVEPPSVVQEAPPSVSLSVCAAAAVQTDVSGIEDPIEETPAEPEVTNPPVCEPSTNPVDTHPDEAAVEETNKITTEEISTQEVPTSITMPVDNIENIITDVIKASCIDDGPEEGEILPGHIMFGVQKKPVFVKQTRKRTQIERINFVEEEPSCKKMKCSSYEESSPIPFTELMIPEVVLTEDLPVSVNIGTMCDPIPSELPAPVEMNEIRPVPKVMKHVDTCEKSVSTDVTKIQFSIYPDTTPSTSAVSVGSSSSNVNKEMYTYFDSFGKHLALYGNAIPCKKSSFYDGGASKAQCSKPKPTPLFTSTTASTSSIRSVIQTKSVSSVSITPVNLTATKTQVTTYPADDMPIDLSKKPSETHDTELIRTRPILCTSRVVKPPDTTIRRSTSTTPDCIAYKVAAARDSITPESGCKLGSSSTTPDSVYSSHDPVPRVRSTTTTAQGRARTYELPRQSPQTMQMMHTRLWDMQELPYHSMLINETPNFQEHLPQTQLMNAPNLIPLQTLSPEYTAQRNLFIANQMYVSALQAFQDAAKSSTNQNSYAAPNRKRTDGSEATRRKKVRDVMTNVPVLSYEQLQQSNIGLERRLEENVFQYQSSTATSQSTSVIQRTEVSSDQSTLTYIHNTPDEECPQLPNMLENYSNLQTYGLNPNIVSQIHNLSTTNRTTKAKSKTPRR